MSYLSACRQLVGEICQRDASSLGSDELEKILKKNGLHPRFNQAIILAHIDETLESQREDNNPPEIGARIQEDGAMVIDVNIKTKRILW